MKLMKKCLMYLYTLIIILQCNSVYQHIGQNNKYFLIVAFGLLCCLVFLEKRVIISFGEIFLIATYVLFLMMLVVVSDFKDVEFLAAVILPFVLGMILFLNENNLFQFLECFSNLMFVICCISLFFFFLGSCLQLIVSTGHYANDIIEWGNNSYQDYYHLYFESQTIEAFGYSGIRNIAIYVEAPMLSYPLMIVCYYEWFLRPKRTRNKNMIIYIITILTSFSTTALLIFAMMVFWKFIIVFENKKWVKQLIFPFILIVIVTVVIYVLGDKVTNGSHSVSIRIDDIMTSIKCFLNYPIKGIGYENLEGMNAYRTLSNKISLSTGLGAIFSFGGLIWGAWYIFPLLVAIKKIITNTKLRNMMGFIVIINVLLCVTVVEAKILCTIMNVICWRFILKNSRFKLKLLEIREN